MREDLGFEPCGTQEAIEHFVPYELLKIKTRLFNIEANNGVYLRLLQQLADRVGEEIELIEIPSEKAH